MVLSPETDRNRNQSNFWNRTDLLFNKVLWMERIQCLQIWSLRTTARASEKTVATEVYQFAVILVDTYLS